MEWDRERESEREEDKVDGSSVVFLMLVHDVRRLEIIIMIIIISSFEK